MSATADALRATMRESVRLTELQHARVQLRWMSALLAGSMLFDLLDPALLLLDAHDTVLRQVARATTLGPVGFAVLFIVLAATLLPYALVQVFAPGYARRRVVTRWASYALGVAGMAWIFLAWRSMPLDVGAVGWFFLRNGVGALLFALAIGLSLNAEQLRNLLERPQ